MTKTIISFAEIAIRNKILADYNSGLIKPSCLNINPKIKSIILPAIQIPSKQINSGDTSMSSNVISDLEEIVTALLIGVGVYFVVNEIDEYFENQNKLKNKYLNK